MADNTWKFLEHQESNPEALKQAVDTTHRHRLRLATLWTLQW